MKLQNYVSETSQRCLQSFTFMTAQWHSNKTSHFHVSNDTQGPVWVNVKDLKAFLNYYCFINITPYLDYQSRLNNHYQNNMDTKRGSGGTKSK